MGLKAFCASNILLHGTRQTFENFLSLWSQCKDLDIPYFSPKWCFLVIKVRCMEEQNLESSHAFLRKIKTLPSSATYSNPVRLVYSLLFPWHGYFRRYFLTIWNDLVPEGDKLFLAKFHCSTSIFLTSHRTGWRSQNPIFKKPPSIFINLSKATPIFPKDFTKDCVLYPCIEC